MEALARPGDSSLPATCPQRGSCHPILRHPPSFLPAPPALLQPTKCPAAAATLAQGHRFPPSLCRLLPGGQTGAGRAPPAQFRVGALFSEPFWLFSCLPTMSASPSTPTQVICWDPTAEEAPCDRIESLQGQRELVGAAPCSPQTNPSLGSPKPPAVPAAWLWRGRTLRGWIPPRSCPRLLTGR